MLDIQRPHRAAVELIDAAAIVADLKTLATTYAGRERELRTAVAQRLKSALTQARAHAEDLLLKDRHGRRCAERLCRVQDEIIRILFEFAGSELYPSQVPSEAERMAVVATGGYGRGLLAPGSDIDLLFLLPVQADRLGRTGRRGAAVLPVGHGAEGRPCHPFGRRMHPAGQSRHDHPHRAP